MGVLIAKALKGLLGTLGSVLMSIAWSFFGEKVVGKAIFALLRSLAKRSATGIDDELVEDAYQSWTKGDYKADKDK